MNRASLAPHAVGESNPAKRVVLCVRRGHARPARDLRIADRLRDPVCVGLRRRAEPDEPVGQTVVRKAGSAAFGYSTGAAFSAAGSATAVPLPSAGWGACCACAVAAAVAPRSRRLFGLTFTGARIIVML